ncbi:cytochrome c-type biogenesis protein [Pasteurella canis]|uniref:cytochrome c-type biogenesis protein n=1 Tax=Pasteurella canis TaxID=753 RepID=UPI000D9D4249|nr:cytochrome c-type biogenesis protein CcmH [Pasteurella canis]SPY32465.1 cytochrome c-type biogenesis protein CcmH [Pasteurella canis]
MRELTALFLLLLSFSSFAAIDAFNFSSAEQEKDYHALTQELRCPQCQNNNIADSNATIAVDMRHKVLELLQKGHSKQEIVDYMVDRYGHFVTYDPPLTAATIALWVIPAMLVIFGVVILFRRQPKATQSAVTTASILSDDEKQRLHNLLKEKKS